MKENKEKLRAIWNQGEIPVLLRRGGNGQRLRLRLPYARDNLKWLQKDRSRRPVWVAEGRYWEVPKAWFNDLVNHALEDYGKIYVIQPYREQEKCAPACWNAKKHECQCSCMGANHGAGNDGSWFVVTDTFAVRWESQQLACRLMCQKNEFATCSDVER